MGRKDEARTHFEAAAHYSTAYYGQIARARLGHKDIVVRPPPEPPDRRDFLGRLEVVRAIELLYAIDERDLIAGSLADLGEPIPPMQSRSPRWATSPASTRTARAMLLLGKAALARGLPLEHYAFPTVGIPDYRPIGPAVEPAIVYAIARQESTFNPNGSRARTPWG